MNKYTFKLNEKNSIIINISDNIIPERLEDMDDFEKKQYARIFLDIHQACLGLIHEKPELENSIEPLFNDFLDKNLNTIAYTGHFKVSGSEAFYVDKKEPTPKHKRLPNPCRNIKEAPLDVENLPLPKGHEKEPHPHADIFPYMGEGDFTNLYKSIEEHGLLESIKLYEGKVIDGRNRLRACHIANITPRYEDIETDDTLDYVLSTNQHRRHLTTGQKAIIAALMSKNDEHITQSQMAKTMNVSLRSVATTADIMNKVEPEVIESLKAGHITINTAKKIACMDADEQKTAVNISPRKRNAYIKSKLEKEQLKPKETVVKLMFSEKEMNDLKKHVKNRSELCTLLKVLVVTELNNYMERFKKVTV